MYEDGKLTLFNYCEDGETVESQFFKNEQLSMLVKYENDEEILGVHYTNNKIKLYYIAGDNETRLVNGKLSKITEYDENNHKITIFDNDKIKNISKYIDDELIAIDERENILNIEALEDKYLKIHNKMIAEYSSSHISYDSQCKRLKIIPADAGYIYVLVNSSLDGMVKIGKTTRTSEERAKELSSTTGVPTPFVVAYESYFNNCSEAERYIHKLLENENNRTSKKREFFNISSSYAIQVIIDAKEYLEEKTN
jgi:hypothetical protein